jgi:streptogramin lyase
MRTHKKLIAALLLCAAPALAQNASMPAPAGAPTTPAGGRGAGRALANPVPDIPMPAAPYHVENDWAKLPAGRTWGAASAIDIDRDGKTVWVFERCGNTDDGCVLHKDVDPIMHFDANGKLLKSFGAGMFAYPHGIFIDRDDNVWVVDGTSKSKVKGDTIRKFSPDGKLLLTMGTPGVTGDGPYVYSGVSDVLQAPDGSIFVADGHDPDSNSRVIKYDRNGKFILQFGQRGTGPTDFNPPHGLAMDKEGRLYIADRGNRAVKRFDQNGKLLDVWTQFGAPSGVFIDKNDILYVADSTDRTGSGFTPGIRMAKVSDGKIFGNIPWPEQGTIEGVAVADDGTIYGGFTNIPGAHRFIKN